MTSDLRDAVNLLEKYQEEVAQAVVAQLARSVPAYKKVDPYAARQSITQLLKMLNKTMTTNSPQPLLTLVREQAALRQASGMGLRSLIASSHCYLPVIRRVLVARASDPLAGLRAFELLESHLLYLVVESTMAMVDNINTEQGLPPTSHHDDDEDTVTLPAQKRFTLAPFAEYVDW